MKVILCMVMSLDGKTTKWNRPNIYEWTSKEDQKHFASIIQKHKLIVMGKKTYLAAKSNIQLAKGKLRIVMTKHPKKFKKISVPGQLEFVVDSPKEIVKICSKLGYKEMLLVGGETINTLFLKQKLINELWITVEPYIFGKGNGLFSEEMFDLNLKMKSHKKLNKKGTILLRYQVSKG